MNDPLKLYEEEFERTKKSPFKCLQHGDVWHNNCLFKRVPENETKFALVDWQVFQFHLLLYVMWLKLKQDTKPLMRNMYILF